MGNNVWVNTLVAIMLAIVGGIVIWVFITASAQKEDVDLMQCEKINFVNKGDYYSCVQAREAILIRQILERYE